MKVTAISGSGRTGSTLLSILLSQHADVVNLGQVRDLWAACSNDAPCSCGRVISACPFWGQAAHAVFGARIPEAMREMHASMRAFMAEASGLPDWNKADDLAQLARRHQDYLHSFRASRGAGLRLRLLGLRRFVQVARDCAVVHARP